MIDRAKVEQFIRKMDGNKYLATIFLIKRINQIQANQAKLIAGSQRFMVEQAIDEFLAGKSTMTFEEPNTDVIANEQPVEETIS
jgi:DNA-directed RNA polymerase subunit K/omega